MDNVAMRYTHEKPFRHRIINANYEISQRQELLEQWNLKTTGFNPPPNDHD